MNIKTVSNVTWKHPLSHLRKISILIFMRRKAAFCNQTYPWFCYNYFNFIMFLCHWTTKTTVTAVFSVSSLLHKQHAEVLTEVLTVFYWREKHRACCNHVELLTRLAHGIYFAQTHPQTTTEKHRHLVRRLFRHINPKAAFLMRPPPSPPSPPRPLRSIIARDVDLAFMCVWTANSEVDQ